MVMKTLIGLVLIVALVSGCAEEISETAEEYCTETGTGERLSFSEAVEVAMNSECGEQGALKDTYMCNEYTGTWWIDLEPYTGNEMCNPACVVNVATKQAEINWRCTGALPE